MSPETRRAVFLFAVLALLYFYGLDKTGVISADEPRYAAIGLEMAHSGDWITPRLWGSPWFEKPPLLYWMTGAATLAGLGPDLAPRLPVALLGFAFLVFLYWFVRGEFGETEAIFSVAVLGASAGWIAYSFAAVTDMPLSATFCAALLLSLRLERTGRGAIAVGALLGAAVLAKGLVPLALYLPVAILLRRRIRELLIIAAACLLVAGPWYAIMLLRFGHAFFDEFIIRHHFERITSSGLMHVRPIWWYLPVLLAGLIPWTAALTAVRARHKFLALWTLYAFAFFSIPKNKLPGYLLPLLPAIAILIAMELARVRRARFVLAVSALLIGIVPIVASIVPQALTVGLSRAVAPPLATILQAYGIWIAAAVACAAMVLVLEFQDRHADAVVLIAVALAITFWKAKLAVLPVLDRTVSVRQFYQKNGAAISHSCLQDVARSPEYGLDYYAGKALPACTDSAARPQVNGSAGSLALLD